MPNEIRQAALNYCMKNFSVIPIEVRGKRPLVQWEEYQTKRAKEMQIKEWWQHWPNANVGVVTGAISGIVVIDIDTKEAGRILREQVEIDFRNTPRVRTGKGWQLYYRHPQVKLNNRTAVIPNLDVRGDGGYVVAPPSIHPSGARYLWEVSLGDELPLMSAELYQLIKEPPLAHESIKDSVIWEGVPEGQRDVQLFKYACHLRAFNCPEDVAFDLVIAAAERCKPPLSATEAQLKLRQAYKYPPGNKSSNRHSVVTPEQPDFWPLLHSARNILEHIDTTKWLWHEALPEGGIGMIAGQPRVGKSTLALNLGLAIARGADFLNRKTVKSRVAYISVDNSVSEMKNIAGTIGLRESDDLLFHVGQIPAQATAWLFDTIIKNNIKFAVIDTFQRFLGIQEINDSAAVTKAMDPINHEAEKLGCSLLWVHHSGKSNVSSTGALGSIAIKGMCPYYFELAREEGARIFVSDLRGGRNFEGSHLKIDHSTGWNQLAGNRQDALIERAAVKIRELLITDGPLTEKSILELIEIRRGIATRGLRYLLKNGQVERSGIGGRSDPFKYTAAAELVQDLPVNANGTSYIYIGKRNKKESTKENQEHEQKQDVILVPAVAEQDRNKMGPRWEQEWNMNQFNLSGERPTLCRKCYVPMSKTPTGLKCLKCGFEHRLIGHA